MASMFQQQVEYMEWDDLNYQRVSVIISHLRLISQNASSANKLLPIEQPTQSRIILLKNLYKNSRKCGSPLNATIAKNAGVSKQQENEEEMGEESEDEKEDGT